MLCKILIDRARLESNKKTGSDLPVIIIETDGKKEHVRAVRGNGPFDLRVHPKDEDGATVWIEAEFKDLEIEK